VTASGLKPARYALVLSRVAGPTTCLAAIATGVATGGEVILAGTLPKRLQCFLGRNPSFGSVALTTGTYWLSVGELVPPDSFSPSASFAKTKIELVK
jgi:hypothetical protein